MLVVWTVVWLLLFVYVYDLVMRRRLPQLTTFDAFEATQPTTTQICYLPGILAEGDLQLKPVLDTVREFGNVLCTSYGTERFDGQKKACIIARRFLQELESNRPEKLVLMGSSMGALLSLDVWAKIRHDLPDEVQQVELVVADGIQGSENMLGGGNIAAPLLSFLPFGPIANRVLKWPFRKMQLPPKDNEIQSDLDKDQVKQDAVAAMAPYKISIWRDQLVYMAGHNHLYPSNFKGLDRVYYLVCTKGNVTVRQTAEMDKWQAACVAAGVEFVPVAVKTPHCAYAQMPRKWNDKFRKVLNGEYVNA